jgi:hypothetical protein
MKETSPAASQLTEEGTFYHRRKSAEIDKMAEE